MTPIAPASSENSAPSVDTLIHHLRSLNITGFGATIVGYDYMSVDAIGQPFGSITYFSLLHLQVLTSGGSRAGLSKAPEGGWESGDGGIYRANVV